MHVQDGRACTAGLNSLAAVRVLRLEHVKVTCLPPCLEELSLVRCRLGAPQLEAGRRLRSLTLDCCTGQVDCLSSHHCCCTCCPCHVTLSHGPCCLEVLQALPGIQAVGCSSDSAWLLHAGCGYCYAYTSLLPVHHSLGGHSPTDVTAPVCSWGCCTSRLRQPSIAAPAGPHPWQSHRWRTCPELAGVLPQVASSPGGSPGAPPVDLEQWVRRTRPEELAVTGTHASIGDSVAAFADQLALSKVRPGGPCSVRLSE